MSDNPGNNTLVIAQDYGWFLATPAAGLRFVKRDGQRILQQQWKIEHSKNGVSFEWKDIPMEDE